MLAAVRRAFCTWRDSCTGILHQPCSAAPACSRNTWSSLSYPLSPCLRLRHSSRSLHTFLPPTVREWSFAVCDRSLLREQPRPVPINDEPVVRRASPSRIADGNVSALGQNIGPFGPLRRRVPHAQFYACDGRVESAISGERYRLLSMWATGHCTAWRKEVLRAWQPKLRQRNRRRRL